MVSVYQVVAAYVRLQVSIYMEARATNSERMSQDHLEEWCLTADVLKVAAAAVPCAAGTLVQRPSPLAIQRKHLCTDTASSSTPSWLGLEQFSRCTSAVVLACRSAAVVTGVPCHMSQVDVLHPIACELQCWGMQGHQALQGRLTMSWKATRAGRWLMVTQVQPISLTMLQKRSSMSTCPHPCQACGAEDLGHN